MLPKVLPVHSLQSLLTWQRCGPQSAKPSPYTPHTTCLRRTCSFTPYTIPLIGKLGLVYLFSISTLSTKALKSKIGKFSSALEQTELTVMPSKLRGTQGSARGRTGAGKKWFSRLWQRNQILGRAGVGETDSKVTSARAELLGSHSRPQVFHITQQPGRKLCCLAELLTFGNVPDAPTKRQRKNLKEQK